MYICTYIFAWPCYFRDRVEKCAELLDRGLDVKCRNPTTGKDAFDTAREKQQRKLQRRLGEYMK